MEETISNKKLLTTQEAVDELVGEQFVEWLFEFIVHELQTWPPLEKISSGKFKQEKIRKFMIQRYLDSKAVWGGTGEDPGFLGFVIANLSESDDPTAETALSAIEVRYEEEKHGLSRELWENLMKELGVGAEELKLSEPKESGRNYVSDLSELYSASEWQTAAGALAAYQIMNLEESRALVQLLKNNTQVSDPGLQALKISAEQDNKTVINPAKILEKIVFDKENKQLVWNGVWRHLDARKLYCEKIMKYLE
ncbi:MAG: hypothetical protein HYW51_00920 [Candidatus Doudnabacteria bacterium]|nr:hypothetical protein [Candidatus Doudnabacteria bacterium]